MRHILDALHGRRALAVAGALWLLASIGLCLTPPTQSPGFLHALAINALAGTLGLWVALAAGRIVLEHAGSKGPGTDTPDRPPISIKILVLQTMISWGLIMGLIASSLIVSLVNGLRVGLCDVWSALPLYLLLPGLSALFSAALGTVVATCGLRWPAAACVAIGALLVTGLATVWPIMTGPQAFAYNHLLGHVPGPLYDERFAVDMAFLGWRALTLSWVALLLGAGALAGHRLDGRPGFPKGPVALTLIALVAIGALGLNRSSIGFYQSHASVAKALGGHLRTDSFDIYYPAERSKEWLERVVRDHEYQHRVLCEWLDLDPATLPRVKSYVFRSAREKQRLTGAGRTSIAKPWLWAMYIQDRPYPHPVLRHELAHVLSASFGSFPLKVSSTRSLGMNTGLIEGLAVAADWPADELSVHGWARAMRAVGVAPDIRGLFSASGFFKESSSRAYTLAGSFVRWLADHRGIDDVKAAYRHGDLSVLGDPEALFSAWEDFLDESPVDEETLRLAQHRFRRPSILRRPCAFDVSKARDQARRSLAAGNVDEARRWLVRAVRLEPEDPWHQKSLLDALLTADALDEAHEAAHELLVHDRLDDRLRASVKMVLADLAWSRNDDETAVEIYQRVASLFGPDPLARLAVAKSWAAGHPALSRGLRPLLLEELRRDLALFHLRELLEEHRDEPMLHYLIGRQLYNAGAHERAVEYLSRSIELGLMDEAGMRIEALRLLARALYDDGTSFDTATRAWEALAADLSVGEGIRLQALDWARRSRFADTTRLEAEGTSRRE